MNVLQFKSFFAPVALPLMLGAGASAARAAPEVQDRSGTASQIGATRQAEAARARAQAHRRAAREAAAHVRWVEAASHWRGVLYELRQIEHASVGGKLSRPSPGERLGREEAERELRLAQSHLSAFWSVPDLVTVGADSRNPIAVSPHSEPRGGVVLDKTRVLDANPVIVSLAQRAVPRQHAELGSHAVAVARLTAQQRLKPAAARNDPRQSPVSGEREAGKNGVRPRSTQAALSWARSQWWTGSLVQPGVDSRNPVPRLAGSATVPFRWAKGRVAQASPRAPRLVPRIAVAPRSGKRGHSEVRGQLEAAPFASSSRRALGVQVPGPSRVSIPDSSVIALARVSPPSDLLRSSGRVTSPVAVAPPVAVPGALERPRLVERRAWTMQFRLPGAVEAASAARRALGSQP